MVLLSCNPNIIVQQYKLSSDSSAFTVVQLQVFNKIKANKPLLQYYVDVSLEHESAHAPKQACTMGRKRLDFNLSSGSTTSPKVAVSS